MRQDKTSPAKRKQKNTDHNDDVESPKKKPKTDDFTEITFKYRLKDPATTFSALSKFTETAQQWSPDQGYDIVCNYCRTSAECNEIFQVLDAGKRKPYELATIFGVLEAILLRIADDLEKFSMVGQNIVRKVLSSHLATAYFSLQMTNKSSHIKATVKLLTAMVMLGDRSARMVLAQFDFHNKIIPPLLNRTDKKDPKDVRTCMLHFILSFLMVGSDDVIKQLLGQRGFLGNVFTDLNCDNADNIQLILVTLLHKIVQNPCVSKTQKVQLFTESAMRSLGQMYHWTGPSYWRDRSAHGHMDTDTGAKTEDQKLVAEVTQNLLMELCSSYKNGINFYDKSLGTSGKNQNHILTAFLTSLTRVTETAQIQELITKTLRACPDQLSHYLPSMLNTLSPHPSPKWLAAMAFLCKIFERQSDLPAAFKIKDRVYPHKFVDMLLVDTIPPQQVLHTVLQALKHRHITVRDTVLDFVSMVLRRAMFALDCLTSENLGRWYSVTDTEDIQQDYRERVIKSVPEIKALLVCWDRVVSGSDDNTQEPDNEDGSLPEKHDVAMVTCQGHMIKLQKTMILYQDLMPSVLVDDPTVIYKLLGGVKKLSPLPNTDQSEANREQIVDKGDQSETIKDGDDQSNPRTFDHMLPQLYLLKLLARTDARKLPWGRDSQDGRSLMYMLLGMMAEISTSSQAVLTMTTKDLICQLLYRTGLFDHHQGELQLWIRHFVLSMQNLTTADDKVAVIKFLTQVFTTYIKNPYPYVDKVSDFVSEAITMEMTGSGNLDNVSIGTNDSIIDGILEMEDEMEPETITDVTEAETDDTFRFPYSPMVVIALEHLKKTEESTQDVTAYLSGMVLDLFHCQLQPLPFVSMLSSCHGDQLDSEVIKYILSWLPSKKMRKVKLCGGGVRMLTSESLMRAFTRTCAKSDRTGEITKSIGDTDVDDMLLVTKQLLLYVVTMETAFIKTGLKSTEMLIEDLLESVNTVVQVCVTKDTSSSVARESALDDIDDDLLSDLSQGSRSELLYEVLHAVLTHPVLLKWFLYPTSEAVTEPVTEPVTELVTEPVKSTENHLTDIVTAHMSRLLSSIENQELRNLKFVVKKYVEKIVKFMKSVENEFSLFSRQEVVELIQSNMGLLTKYLDTEDQLSLIHTLLQWSNKGQDASLELSPLDSCLIPLLEGIVKSSKSHQLQLLDFDLLSDIMSRRKAPALENICYKLLQIQPHFCIAVTKRTIWRLMESCSEVQQSIVGIVIRHSWEARSYVTDWVMGAEDLGDHKLRILPVLNAYLQCLVDRNAVTMDAAKKIYSMYMEEIGALMDVREADDVSSLCDLFYLLCQLSLTDKDKQTDMCRSITAAVKSKQPIRKKHIHLLRQLTSLAPEGSTDPVTAVTQLYYTCKRCLLYTLQKKDSLETDLQEYLLEVISHLSQDTIQQLKPSELQKDFSSFVRNCLRSLYTTPRTFRVLEMLVRRVYPTEASLDLTPAMILDMTISHSMFVDIMLGEKHSNVKESLVDLLCALTELSPSSCSPDHIGVYLGGYSATLSQTDQKLVKLIQQYEANGVSLREYRPYLWGPKAAEQHTMRKSLGSSLWKQPSTQEVLECLDRDRLQRSILKFPLLRRLQPGVVQKLSTFGVDDDLYDPCFILPMFSSLLSPDTYVDCRKFAETSCLGYTIAALSCHDSGIRGVAYHVLARYLHHLEGARFHEQQQILYLVSLLRDSVTHPNTKLACIITVFLTKMVALMFSQGDHMYKVMNHFLLLKPALDIHRVPDFYKLFNSSDFEFKVERSWILSLFEDGLRETFDYKILEKRYIFKLLLSFHDSGISDNFTQLQVLNILKWASQQRTVAFDLVKHHGILSWLTGVINTATSASHLNIVTDIFRGLWFSMVRHYTIRGENSGTEDQTAKCLPLAISREMLMCLLALIRYYRVDTNTVVYEKCLVTIVSVLNHLQDSVVLLKDKGHHVRFTPLTTQDVCCVLVHSSRQVDNTSVQSTCTEALKLLNLRTSPAAEKCKPSVKHDTTGPVGPSVENVTESEPTGGGEQTDDCSGRTDVLNNIWPVTVDLLSHWQPSYDLSSDKVKVTCSVAMAAISFMVSSVSSRNSLTAVARIVDWIHGLCGEDSCLVGMMVERRDKQFIKSLLQVYEMIYTHSHVGQFTCVGFESSKQESTRSCDKGCVRYNVDGSVTKMNAVMCNMARHETEVTEPRRAFFTILETAGPESVSVTMRKYFLGLSSEVDRMMADSLK